MISYTNQRISHETCPKRLGPKEWENIFRYTQNEYITDLEFIECDIGGGLCTYGAPLHRSSATNIRVTDCRGASFFGTGAIFEDVVVVGVRMSRAPVILSACAFRHVVLAGNCGRFIFNRNVCHNDFERNEAFAAANDDFYRSTDWALDISRLNCSGFALRGSVPVRLIRRNPSEQFVMTREVALSGAWKEYGPMSWFDLAIEQFLDAQTDEELFVAPRRSKQFKDELGFYLRLKDAHLVY